MAALPRTTPSGVTEPLRLPHRMTLEDEFLALYAHRQRINDRLRELSMMLDESSLPSGVSSQKVTLPLSGLRIVASADGALLATGGPLA